MDNQIEDPVDEQPEGPDPTVDHNEPVVQPVFKTVADLGLPASKKITDANTVWEAAQGVNLSLDDAWALAEDLLVTAALAAVAGYTELSPKAYALLPDEVNNVLRLVIA